MNAYVLIAGSGLLGLASLVMLLPALVLLVQLLGAFLRGPAETDGRVARQSPRIGVLMPAHNEALGLASSLASVQAQLAPDDRLLVVADNCDDATASIARRAGAEVSERHDSVRRGKGFALDHGVRVYAADPVDVLIIVDADCELGPGCLRRVAALAVRTGRPAQALYLMRSEEGAPIGSRVSEFAWRVRNHVRPLGSRNLGWPCQLMGTGMAFPWALIEGAPLASGHLVEDMELGLALASAGSPPIFCPSALVTSRFSRDVVASRSQRTRWEHGHLAMIAGRALPTLLRGVLTGRPAMAAMALDLCVPPLAWFVILQTGLLMITGVWALSAAVAWPWWIASLGAVSIALSIVLAWQRWARDLLAPRELAAIPRYVLGKLPIYLGWFTRRQSEWVRTKRDERTKP